MESDSNHRTNYHIYSQTMKLAGRSKDMTSREATWSLSISKTEGVGRLAKIKAGHEVLHM